jgi:hypothetical protein
MINNVAYLPKARTIKPAERQPLLRNGSANRPVARQQLRKHATIPEPSLSNVPMQQLIVGSGVICAVRAKAIYNEGQLNQ